MREPSNRRHLHGRHYSADELAHFADYRDERARWRPKKCDEGKRCWVRDGPPAYNGTCCIGCQGYILATLPAGRATQAKFYDRKEQFDERSSEYSRFTSFHRPDRAKTG